MRRVELVGAQREHLEESERRGQLGTKRRRAPIVDDCLPDLISERIRRDRAVGARSERALVQERRKAGEELALARRPLGRAAHRRLERVGERPAEELRAIEQRLHDAERLVARALANHREHGGLLGCVAVLDDREPHPITSFARSRRRSPSPIAAATVCSKITSSSTFSSSADTSPSVTVYARSRTLAR